MYEIGEMEYVQTFDVDNAYGSDDLDANTVCELALGAGALGLALTAIALVADEEIKLKYKEKYGSSEKVRAIKSTIEDAYKDGLLTQDEVQVIYEKVQNGGEHALFNTAADLVNEYAQADLELSPIEDSLLKSLRSNK